MAYSKEKQQKLVSSLTSIGALAGDNNIGVAGGIKGLEMSLEQSKCDEQAKSVRDGLFKVAIMGTFSSGKSTVINALIGSNVLPESAMPCTAILTFIQYGTNEDRADVYMADEILSDGSVKSGECVQMSVKDFQNVYKYTLEDEITFKETGTVPRFAKVKYAIMYCSKPLMEGGVSIIDSPGLEDKAIATELALQIAQEAQAIIYVATEKGYGGPDKEYIESTFHNCPNNVFFVINKFDLVKKEERPSSLEKAKLDLASVFTDQNGFNEELCNRRVFGISALRALDSRRGLTYDKDLETEVPLDETQKAKKFEMSWFGPFEKELETFLTTDERCIAQYMKCFRQMASTYRNAEKHVAENILILENEAQIDTDRKSECEKIIADIESNIKQTEATFDNCSLKLQNAISELFYGCVSYIDESWEQASIELTKIIDDDTLINLYTGIRQMNPFISKRSKEEQIKKFSQKFTDIITEHITNKFEAYIADNRKSIDTLIEDCQKRLNLTLECDNNLFDDLAHEIMNGNNVNAKKENNNWSQFAISAFIDAKMAKSWETYSKISVFDSIRQNIVYQLCVNDVPLLLISFLQMRRTNDFIQIILNGCKDEIVNTLKIEAERIAQSLNKTIAAEISNQKNFACQTIIQKLQDEQARMRAIELSNKNHSFNLEEEKKRYRNILSAIFRQANEAYALTFGHEITLHQFKEIIMSNEINK